MTILRPPDESLNAMGIIMDALARDALDGLPQHWKSAALTIDCDGSRIDYRLKNLDGEDGKATISNRLAQLSEDLWQESASSGSAWSQAVLRLSKSKTGEWSFKCEFTYGK